MSLNEQFPGNSRAKKKPPKLEKIANSKVRVQDPSLASKMRESFSSSPSRTILEHLTMEVIIPNVKRMILEFVNQGLETKFYGDGNPRTRPGSGSGYTAYNRIYKSSDQTRGSRQQSSRPVNSVSESRRFKNVIVGDRGEAEMIVDVLASRIEEYDVATVADLYELVDITGEFTDYKYGWTDSRSFRVRPVRDGYLLDLPDPRPID